MKQKLTQLFDHLVAQALHPTTPADAACKYAREAAYLATQIGGMSDADTPAQPAHFFTADAIAKCGLSDYRHGGTGKLADGRRIWWGLHECENKWVATAGYGNNLTNEFYTSDIHQVGNVLAYAINELRQFISRPNGSEAATPSGVVIPDCTVAADGGSASKSLSPPDSPAPGTTMYYLQQGKHVVESIDTVARKHSGATWVCRGAFETKSEAEAYATELGEFTRVVSPDSPAYVLAGCDAELERKHQTMKGKLIVIEGMDGVGKTTQVQHIVEALNTVGQQAVGIREPGGTWLGEQLRTILKSEECQSQAPMAQMLLFAAARAQNVAERIKPLLEAGTWVVMDRFSPSTQVYQGELNRLPDAMAVDELACQGLVPDLTFILDMDVERAALRREEDEKDAWDRKDMRVVRAAYITHAPKWNAVVLDADKSTNALTEEIWMHLKTWLPTTADRSAETWNGAVAAMLAEACANPDKYQSAAPSTSARKDEN